MPCRRSPPGSRRGARAAETPKNTGRFLRRCWGGRPPEGNETPCRAASGVAAFIELARQDVWHWGELASPRDAPRPGSVARDGSFEAIVEFRDRSDAPACCGAAGASRYWMDDGHARMAADSAGPCVPAGNSCLPRTVRRWRGSGARSGGTAAACVRARPWREVGPAVAFPTRVRRGGDAAPRGGRNFAHLWEHVGRPASRSADSGRLRPRMDIEC